MPKTISIDSENREEFIKRVSEQIAQCSSFVIFGSAEDEKGKFGFCIKDGDPQEILDSIAHSIQNVEDIGTIIEGAKFSAETGERVLVMVSDKETVKKHEGKVVPITNILTGKGGEA